MSKPARISTAVPVSSASEKPDRSQLVSIALFAGIGLLISLAAILAGVQGAWY
jgi:preprotein translocase subunit Sss1